MAGLVFNCLAASVFTMAFCLPVGRVLMVVALVLVVADCLRRREMPKIAATTWFFLAFFVVAIVSTVVGIDPGGSWHNLRKLLWYFAVPLFAILVVTPSQLSDILGAYAAGTGVLAVYDLIRNPIMAYKSVAAGQGGNVMDTLVSLGSMTDAQRLMVGVLITLGFLVFYRKDGRGVRGWWILLAIQVLGLLITFKRGSFICLILVLAVFIAIKINWRYLAVLGAVAAVLFLLPPVRARMAKLATEFDSGKGGRATMWFKIAPALHKEYPWFGIGWRAMTADRMQKTAQKIGVNVETNRNHLHSNIAEIIVETGWIGYAVYALWILMALVEAVRFVLGAAKRTMEEEYCSLILLMALVALLLNGLVEFNFADGELVVVYAMIMGCISAGLDHLEFRPAGIGLALK
jgi:hypothetical protein